MRAVSILVRVGPRVCLEPVAPADELACLFIDVSRELSHHLFQRHAVVALANEELDLVALVQLHERPRGGHEVDITRSAAHDPLVEVCLLARCSAHESDLCSFKWSSWLHHFSDD